MKKLWMAIMVFSVLTALAADKLPAYGTDQWRALPGLKEITAAAENGDADAMRLLGIAIYNTKKPLIDAADRKWEFKAYAAGMSIFDAPLDKHPPKKALEIYRKFAETGFYVAQRELASILYQCEDNECWQWYRRAADQGDPISQYNMGKACMEGRFGEPDIQQGLKYWELSAAQENLGALNDLGVAHLEGLGGKADVNKGIHCLKLAAAKKYAPAAYLLGMIYSEGRHGIAVDHAAAAKYLLIAARCEPQVAEQMKLDAQLHVNNAMKAQQQKNFAQRDKFLKLAADSGHPKARSIIIRNKFNAGDEKAKQQALREMTELAEQGSSYAQMNLAFLYFSLRDNEQGIFWYCRALGNGEIAAFTIAPEVIFDNFDKFTTQHKKLLSGVIWRAECFNDPDMLYVATILVALKLAPPPATESDYIDRLIRCGYPKVMLTFYHDILQNDKDLSSEKKADLAIRLQELVEYLQNQVESGDRDAARCLKEHQSKLSDNNGK